ncbi:MAG: beta-lactamase family protein [Candidatus Hydrogenedentes bacterium]|nr:beta-lactamase family protein [Candidatus Hydrogenedentota bacterium]
MISRAEFLRIAGLVGAASAFGASAVDEDQILAQSGSKSAKSPSRPPQRGKRPSTPAKPPSAGSRKPSATDQLPPLDLNLSGPISDLVEASALPGLSIAAIEDNHVTQAQAFGYADKAKSVKVTQDTLFQVASLTKPTFAHLVLKLCESGQLSLDIPLNDYYPKEISTDIRGQRITARDVLAHMSGLPLTHFPNWPEKLEFAPGERFGYSGAAYLFLQEVVENALSRPLDDVMEERILRPLGLRSSSYIWRNVYEEDVAHSYDAEGKVTPERGRSRPKKANAAGSLHTTARGYAAFLIEAILKGDQGKLALDPVYRRMMLSPQIRLNSQLGWGLGWGIEVNGIGDRFWHWGDSRGFMAYAVGSVTERRGIVILTNGTNGLRVCEQIARRTFGEEQAKVFAWIYRDFYGKYDVELPELPEAARKLCLPPRTL